MGNGLTKLGMSSRKDLRGPIVRAIVAAGRQLVS